MDIPTVQRLLNIAKEELYVRLRQLEKLKIIELLTEEKYRFVVSLPVRWRTGGALSDLITALNQSLYPELN